MASARGITLKSKRELAIMREAGRVDSLALQAAKAAIRPGATDMGLQGKFSEDLSVQPSLGEVSNLWG